MKKLELKEKFRQVRGYWDDSLDGLLDQDPEFFEAFLAFTSVPWKRGALDPKTKELCYLSVYANASHLYTPAIKTHVQKAIQHGATKEEILEVFQLVSVIGMHTFLEGLPMLIEEVSKNEVINSELNERKRRLKEEFIQGRGYWNAFWDGLLLLDDEFFEVYIKFSTIPWKKGPLTPKQKEFIYIAGDASATHLYTPGLRVHVQNALKYGATKEEILEVYQLAGEVGMGTFKEGMPILIEELEKISAKN
jgi:alkylhydroperoxidase/carboxymuconolactone decarboxylase family protein YurZ